MTTHDALLAAVLAAPDDDLPRLVYADWLEENAKDEWDTARAWAIRFDKAMEVNRVKEGLVPGLIYESMTPRHVATFVIQASRAGGMECSPGSTFAFRRGFISEVRCTLAAWCGTPGDTEPVVFANAHGSVTYRRQLPGSPGIGPAVVRSHPVTRVVLTDREPAERSGSFLWLVYATSDGTARHVAPEQVWRSDALSQNSLDARRSRLFHTRELAISALSAALILWAKSQPHPARITTSPVSVDMTAG